MANRAAFPRVRRRDWAIIRALSDAVARRLPYDSLASLRQAVFKAAPHLMRIDGIAAGEPADLKTLAGKAGGVEKAPSRHPLRTIT